MFRYALNFQSGHSSLVDSLRRAANSCRGFLFVSWCVRVVSRLTSHFCVF